MSTIKEVLKEALAVLAVSETETPILDAEILLIHVLNKRGFNMNRIKIITESNMQLDETAKIEFIELVSQRKAGKPVQYITGRQEFMGRDFAICENVLIPRGDTEIIVEKTIELAESIKNPKILDMCTGTGAIAISLALAIADSTAVAVDISPAAEECCKKNIEKYDLSDKIEFLKGDLFQPLTDSKYTGFFDIIVSNPPYIPTSVISSLKDGVKKYEPSIALDGGADGLDFYKIIIKQSKDFLKENGILIFEIGWDQGQQIRELLLENEYENINICKDLAGLDRCVYGYR